MSGICIVQFVGGILLLSALLSNLAVSLAQNPPACGRPQVSPSKGFRIVGGGPAANNSWPWACALVEEIYRPKIGMTYRQFCDCTLIDKDWVVTAAHCTQKTERMSRVQFLYYVKVYLGEEDLITAKNNPARKYNISDVIQHAQYIDRTKHNDISLIRLKRSVEKFDNDVMPACLPFRPVTEGPFIQIGKNGRRLAYLGGWGHTFEGQGKAGVVGSGTDTIRQTSSEIYPNAECKRKLPITSTMFCAGYDDGKRDTCQGDSGGPLMVEEEGGVWILHGIVSWGAGCARANSPGVYTSVYVFRAWLTSMTGVVFPSAELPPTTPTTPTTPLPAGKR